MRERLQARRERGKLNITHTTRIQHQPTAFGRFLIGAIDVSIQFTDNSPAVISQMKDNIKRALTAMGQLGAGVVLCSLVHSMHGQYSREYHNS